MDTGSEATVATTNTYPARGIGKLLKIGKIGTIYYFSTTLYIEGVPTKSFICSSSNNDNLEVNRSNGRRLYKKFQITNNQKITPEQFSDKIDDDQKSGKYPPSKISLMRDLYEYGPDAFQTCHLLGMDYTEIFEDDSMSQKDKKKFNTKRKIQS